MNTNQTYCMNCGHLSHCEETLNRKEVELIGDNVAHEWSIDVCKHCRCEECNEA